jgi:hypothetical protein
VPITRQSLAASTTSAESASTWLMVMMRTT